MKLLVELTIPDNYELRPDFGASLGAVFGDMRVRIEKGLLCSMSGVVNGVSATWSRDVTDCTESVEGLVQQLFEKGSAKIDIIKAIRESTGLGLREAGELVSEILRKRGR